MHEKYYLEVDECPYYSWRKANEGKRHFLRKGKEGTKEQDEKAWELLFRNFVEVIGLSEEFEQYLKNLERLNKINSKIISTGDRFLLNEREYLLIDIELFEKQAKENKGNASDSMLILSKFQGYHLKEKEVTVLEYYKLLENYGKANKAV
jgi:hypothetical protein